MPLNHAKLAILVGGGPAPGINAVIGAAAIEAINRGMSVVGIYDGFKHLASDKFVPERHCLELKIKDVARIHFDGGSVLRTSRTTLLDENSIEVEGHVRPDDKKVARVIHNFTDLGVTHLVTIGGDDTALSARFVAERTGGRIRVVHVPKTIDNDLPLPGDIPTFGFNTARHLGSELVANLMEDAKTTGRWYCVVAMGRHAGFLALGIGKATGATVTLIPEEFAATTTVQNIVDVLEGAILKRKAMGRNDGVAIVAEGLAYRLGDKEELERLLHKKVPLDAAGHIRLAEVPLARMLTDEITQRFEARGDKITIVPQTIGYMLRCAPPTPLDMAYCRDLGNGAVRLLLDETRDLTGGVMVTIQHSNLCPVSFHEMVDPATNRTRIRQVDVHTDNYKVARAYMIRLELSDLKNPVMLAKLATAAKMTEEEFVRKYTRAATRLFDSPDAQLNIDIPEPRKTEPANGQ
ncbi:MAG: 6-phosphofructokinase [Planctomycetota bacterium]|nr:MAG: 6-phosphofructokinase [Planctomycetota bacterium]